MEQVFLIREMLIRFFKRHETIILFICKLIVGLIVFSVINGIGYTMPQLAALFKPPYVLPFVMLMSVLFAVCPLLVCYGLIIVNIGMQISGVFGVAVFVLLFLLCVMFFYVRLAPKESALILATYFAFACGVPYAAPLIAGLYFGVTSVIPISIGVFIWEAAPAVGQLVKAGSAEKVGLLELPEVMAGTYEAVFTGVAGGEAWVISAFIFSVVVIVVFAISRSGVNYARDLAVGVGGFTCIIGFLMSAIITGAETDLFSVVIMSFISVLIAELVHFFDIALDYRGAEHVQFEDETNYYIVKVIPKVATMRRARAARHNEAVRGEEENV